MTISSTTRQAGPFAGNDATVAFPFTFKVFTTADVLVALTDTDDVQSVLALTTDYSVVLNADQNAAPGGTVTMVSAPATGESLVITSDVATLQPVNLTNAGGFYPRVLNDAFDRAVIQIQQVQALAGRALLAPIGEEVGALPNAAARASKVLAFGPDGEPIPTDAVSAGAAAAFDLSNVLATIFAAKEFLSTSTNTPRSLASRFADCINAKDMGMVGDYVVDDTARFQACLLLMQQTGRPLYIPEGRYKITSQIVLDMDAVPDNGLGQTGKAAGLYIYGDGHEKTQIDIRGVTASPFFSIISVGAANYPILEDLSIFGDQAGTVLAVGGTALVGPEMNFFRAERCRFQNFDLTAASNAVTVNGLYGGSFNSCIINCGSGGYVGGQGVTVICRQGQFITFDTCSIGSAFTGFKFQDGSNASVVLVNCDFENVQVCVEFATGTNFSCNLIGGRAAYSSFGVVADACLDCHWYSPNIGASGGGTEDNFIKKPCTGNFTLHGSYPLNVTTPAVPATTVTATNDQGRAVEVSVRPGTATISAILKNGVTQGHIAGPVFLAPRDTIALAYTAGTPTWTWSRR